MNTPENKMPEEALKAEEPEGVTAGEPAPPIEAPVQAPEEVGVAAVPQVPEDLRTPWTWLDLLIFVLFGFGSLLVLTNVLASIAADLYHLSRPQLLQFATTSAGFVTLRQTLWFAVMMGYLFLVVRVRQRVPFWKTIGWRELRIGTLGLGGAALLCVLGGFVLAIVVQIASAMVGKPPQLPIEALFRDRRSVLLVMSMGVLLAPVVEETIFRGFIYPVAARSFGVPFGIVFTGTLFGLLHAPQLWGGWGQIALLIAVGIAFTTARARTGTVVATYFLHLGYNTFLFLAFYFATGGLRYFPGQ
jgi:membrane protease YdiL (CAAX protease family)